VRLEELLLRELPFLSAERESLFPPVESATEKMTDLRSATGSARTLGGDSREKTTHLTRQLIGDTELVSESRMILREQSILSTEEEGFEEGVCQPDIVALLYERSDVISDSPLVDLEPVRVFERQIGEDGIGIVERLDDGRIRHADQLVT